MGEGKYAMTQHSSAQSSAGRTNISNLLNRLTLSSNPFKNLPSSSYILLLTPYLQATPPHINSEDEDMDPFEPFGRALVEYYRNIRHSPYIAKHGMVEVHRRLLDEAAGIIVVLCKPPKTKKIKSDQRLDASKYQERFAKEVGKYIEDADVPSVLVTIGLGGVTESKRFDNTLELQDWSELEQAADRIYGG